MLLHPLSTSHTGDIVARQLSPYIHACAYYGDDKWYIFRTWRVVMSLSFARGIPLVITVHCCIILVYQHITFIMHTAHDTVSKKDWRPSEYLPKYHTNGYCPVYTFAIDIHTHTQIQWDPRRCLRRGKILLVACRRGAGSTSPVSHAMGDSELPFALQAIVITAGICPHVYARCSLDVYFSGQ